MTARYVITGLFLGYCWVMLGYCWVISRLLLGYAGLLLGYCWDIAGLLLGHGCVIAESDLGNCWHSIKLN